MKVFLSSPNKKVVLSHGFLNFLRIFLKSLRSNFFESGKILPHPREFDHHFLPRGRELDKKICSLKKFYPGLPGGGMYSVGID